jgi:hypothetical protein
MDKIIRKPRDERKMSPIKEWPLVAGRSDHGIHVTYQDLWTIKEVFTFRATNHGFQFVAFDEYRISRSGDWEPTGKLWRSSDDQKSFKPFVPHGVLAAAMREYLKEKTQ